jgi:hypothetical protein
MNTNETTKEAQVIEIRDNVWIATKEYVKTRKLTEFTKLAHAGAMVNALLELGLLVEDIEGQMTTKETAFHALCELENGSQVRQTLEKAGAMPKKATALVDSYV